MSRGASSRGGRRFIATLAAVGAMTLSTVAAADEDRPAASAPAKPAPSASGFRVALRTGVAVPLGEAFVSSGSLATIITGYVPLRLDIGYRFAHHFYFGVAGQLALIMPNGCPGGSDCSGSNTRLGVMVAYHLLPAGDFDPWLAVGMGYERLSVSREASGTRVDISARGLELLDVELGADIRASRTLRFGPVLSTSAGRYTTVSVNGSPTRDFDASLHAWVMLGLRGAFEL